LLGQSVGSGIAEQLSNDPEARTSMRIGTRREATILFSDIRGFTAWSETQTPEEVKARLDEYFPVMCEIAEDDHGGFIDKFIGDELMVVWNVPYDQDDHMERAVRAALSMQRSLDMLNAGWTRQKQEGFRIGIGIATGRVVFGTFGSLNHKLQPTVLGDAVNLASRLQATTKETGAYIVVDELVYQCTRNSFEMRSLGVVPIRGKADMRAIYEVIGTKGKPFLPVSEMSEPILADNLAISDDLGLDSK
jgi:adenylate cyclase